MERIQQAASEQKSEQDYPLTKTPSVEQIAEQIQAKDGHKKEEGSLISETTLEARAPQPGDPVSMPSPLPIDIEDTGGSQDLGSPKQSFTIPDLNTMRDEVRQNPHQVPPSLTRFARDLARNMEEVKRFPSHAPSLYKSLESCVDNEGPQAVRALCFTNAEKLSKLYPSFSSRFKELEGRTPAVITRLTRPIRPSR